MIKKLQTRKKQKEFEEYKQIVKMVDSAHRRALKYIRESLKKQQDCKIAV